MDPEVTNLLNQIDSRINTFPTTNTSPEQLNEMKRLSDRVNSIKNDIANKIKEDQDRMQSYWNSVKTNLTNINREIDNNNNIVA